MNREQTFIANTQSTKLMQPSDGAFHHAAGLAQIAAMRGATLGKLVPDSPVLQDLSMLALDRRHAIEQWNKLRDAMPIGLATRMRRASPLDRQ
jgi:hypothetical protein